MISKHIEFLSLKIEYVLAKSEDPNEMPHYMAFHLGFYCLPKYLVFKVLKALNFSLLSK